MVASEYIGLDVGKSRTGFARGSSMARLAEALETVPTGMALNKLSNLLTDDVAGVVVGLPRNLEGSDTQQTSWVRQWVDEAKKKINTTFYWQDEALTSKLAEARAIKGRAADIDSLAAQIILQDFLDSPEAMRIIC